MRINLAIRPGKVPVRHNRILRMILGVGFCVVVVQMAGEGTSWAAQGRLGFAVGANASYTRNLDSASSYFWAPTLHAELTYRTPKADLGFFVEDTIVSGGQGGLGLQNWYFGLIFRGCTGPKAGACIGVTFDPISFLLAALDSRSTGYAFYRLFSGVGFNFGIKTGGKIQFMPEIGLRLFKSPFPLITPGLDPFSSASLVFSFDFGVKILF